MLLSKTFYPLLSTGSAQEDLSVPTCLKIVDWEIMIRNKSNLLHYIVDTN